MLTNTTINTYTHVVDFQVTHKASVQRVEGPSPPSFASSSSSVTAILSKYPVTPLEQKLTPAWFAANSLMGKGSEDQGTKTNIKLT